MRQCAKVYFQTNEDTKLTGIKHCSWQQLTGLHIHTCCTILIVVNGPAKVIRVK